MMSFSIRSLGMSDNIGEPSFGGEDSSDGGGGNGCVIAFARCPDPAPKSTTVLNCRLMSWNQFEFSKLTTMNRSTSRIATSSRK